MDNSDWVSSDWPICPACAPSNQPPVADAGPDQTIDCALSTGADVTLDGSGSDDPDDDPLSYTWSEDDTKIAAGEIATVTLLPGTHTITLTVDDNISGTDSDQVTITVIEDTTPPTITLNGDAELDVECNIGTYTEQGATAMDLCDGAVGVSTSGSVDVSTLGDYTITYTATDANGNADSDTRIVHVVDTTPPEITGVPEEPVELWPPNHKMVLVAAGISATDKADPSPVLSVVVTSNESENGKGDGDTEADWDVVENVDGSLDVWVRAERSGNGEGRVYTITVTAVDASENESEEQTATVTVPHDKGKKGKKKLVLPGEYALLQNAPNPFNPETTIEYALPEEAYVRLVIYNPMGQLVRTLVEGFRSGGYHQVVWDGRDSEGRSVSGGVYFYRLTAGKFTETKRMMLLR